LLAGNVADLRRALASLSAGVAATGGHDVPSDGRQVQPRWWRRR
jgi:hypothetical protein